MPRSDSLQAKIEQRIAERSEDVFLTREFADLGGERQVLRALSKEVEAGVVDPAWLWRVWESNTLPAFR